MQTKRLQPTIFIYILIILCFVAAISSCGKQDTQALAAKQSAKSLFKDLSTSTIADMKTNTPVSITLLSGLTEGATWSLTDGSLPTGSGTPYPVGPNCYSGTGAVTLCLEKNGGTIYGTPTIAGDYTFRIKAISIFSNDSASRTYSVSVRDPLRVTNSSLKPWIKDQPGYLDTLTATGGRGPYTWAIASGLLPSGLSINSSTGVISGTPTAAGTYNFTVSVTDNATVVETAIQALSIVISDPDAAPQPLNVVGSTRTFNVDSLINESLTPSDIGGTPPYTWSLIAGNVPTGSTDSVVCAAGTGKLAGKLCLDPSGSITGTPTVAASYSFQLKVVDITGALATPIYTYKIIAPLLITTTTVKSPDTGQQYSETLQATGGTAPYIWSYTPANPVPGLTFKNDGTITGTPTTAGNYTFSVTVTDSASSNNTNTKTFSLSVTDQFKITTTTLPGVALGSSYNQTITASGGRIPYTYAVTAGSLPAGLTLNKDTGIIAGTTTVAGTYSFIITGTDADFRTTSGTFTVTVGSGGTGPTGTPPTIVNTTLPNVATSSVYNQTIIVSGGNVPYSFQVTAGSLPTGLSLNKDTGGITGQAQVPGTFSFIVTVTDANSLAATNTYTITVGSGSTIVTVDPVTPGKLVTFGNITKYDLPTTGAPLNFIPYSGVDFTVANVTSGGLVKLNIEFTSLPENPVFYKIINDKWLPLTKGIDYTLSGKTLTMTVRDNGSFDSNPTLGVVSDPIVVGITDDPASVPVNNSPSSSGSGGGGCFIATAAYGSYLDPHVMVLRDFRDNVLLKTAAGTAFVKLYYTYSPQIADFIREHELLRAVVRLLLTPLIILVKFPAMLPLVFFGIIAVVWRMLNKAFIKKLICSQES